MEIKINFKKFNSNGFYDVKLFDVDLTEYKYVSGILDENLNLALDGKIESFCDDNDIQEWLYAKYEFGHGEWANPNVNLIFKYKDVYFKVYFEIEWNRYDKQFYFIENVNYLKHEIVEVNGDGVGILSKIKDLLKDTEYEINLVNLVKL
jgi:hypothetical protein